MKLVIISFVLLLSACKQYSLDVKKDVTYRDINVYRNEDWSTHFVAETMHLDYYLGVTYKFNSLDSKSRNIESWELYKTKHRISNENN